MAAIKYQLTQQESTRERLLHIVNSQTALLRARARSKQESHDKITHDLRTTIKSTRAIWRLLRPLIPPESFQTNNARLRDAARALSSARDTIVACETMKEMFKAHLNNNVYFLFAEALEGLVKEEIFEVQAQQSEFRRLQLHAVKALNQSIKAQRKLPLSQSQWQLLEPGLQQSYRSARKRMATARADRNDEALHDWRKSVKYLWYQFRLIEPSWPHRLKQSIKRLKELEKLLGHDHDLLVLHQRLTSNPAQFGGDDNVAQIVKCLEERRATLQTTAFKLGKKLFRNRPKRVIKKLRKHWRKWQQD